VAPLGLPFDRPCLHLPGGRHLGPQQNRIYYIGVLILFGWQRRLLFCSLICWGPLVRTNCYDNGQN
jgi:hypothetical protein